MSQKNRIRMCCFWGILLLVAFAVVFLFLKQETVSKRQVATAYEQLKLSIAFPGGKQEVGIWQNEDGYYFFLPSGAEKYELHFSNIGSEASVQLAGNAYTEKDSLTEDLKFNEAYEMEVTLPGQSWGTVQVSFWKSENLPSLYIETVSGSVDSIHEDKEVKEGASMVLVGADGACEYAEELDYIKTRGNSTFYDFDKKSYQIKLLEKSSLLGMDSADKWILLANSIDDTLMKNELVHSFAQEYTSLPSCQGEYVDLYLNGNYVGNYYFCEKVEIGEGRLEITDLEKSNKKLNAGKAYDNPTPYLSADGKIKAVTGLKNPQDITGGYLIECTDEAGYAETLNAFVTDMGNYYEIVSPSPATVEQAEYICNLFNEMEAAMVQADGVHPETGKHISEYMDVDSWATKYLLEEAFNDPDAKSGGSMFFYKDSDKVDAHIYAGPIWDYDRAMGSYGVGGWGLDNAEHIGEYGIYVSEMMQHAQVQESVKKKLSDAVAPYVRNLLRADVYYLKKQINASVAMNKIRWPELYGYYSDYEAATEYLSVFMEKKVSFLESIWVKEEEYCKVSFKNYTGEVFEEAYVRKGGYIQNIPSVYANVAVFVGWYDSETGEELDSRRPVLHDVTYEGNWVHLSDIVQNWDTDDMSVWGDLNPEVLRYLADLLEEKQKG